MWDRRYQDYPEDASLRTQRVEAGHGVKGCEMKERCGWGLTKQKQKPTSGWLRGILSLFVSIGGKK